MYSLNDLWNTTDVLYTRHATIRLAVDGDTKRAIKSMPLHSSDSLQAEENFLKRIHSPFVIKSYGNEITLDGTTENYNIVLDYCSGGSLCSKCYRFAPLPLMHVKELARDILHGLSDIHAANVAHCDLNPQNILLYEPNPKSWRLNGFTPLIADFESAMEIGSSGYGELPQHRRNDIRYKAPEILDYLRPDYRVDCKVDIWSFGLTVLEMLTGKSPWHRVGEPNYRSIMASVNFNYSDLILGSSNLPNSIPYSSLSLDACDFIYGCLRKHPFARPTAEELLRHPFMRN